jgi:hypothetical protein
MILAWYHCVTSMHTWEWHLPGINLIVTLIGVAISWVMNRIHRHIVCSPYVNNFASATKKILGILDPIHNCAIYLCIGVFRTSRVEVCMQNQGICTHQQIVLCNHVAKLSTLKKYPFYRTVQQPSLQRRFALNLKTNWSAGIIFKELMNALQISTPPSYPFQDSYNATVVNKKSSLQYSSLQHS